MTGSTDGLMLSHNRKICNATVPNSREGMTSRVHPYAF